MKKFLKYFVFSILCIEIFNIFSLYQVKAENNNLVQNEVVYQNGDLRCPPNSSASECQLKNNGAEAVVTYKENDVIITKHVQKTDTIGRYKIWFDIQNNGETTTQVVSSRAYVYFIADASSTNDGNLNTIKNALKSFYGILAKKNVYFTGGSFAKGAVNFSSDFKTSANDLKINLNPSGSTSHIYKSLNNAANMFKKDYINPEDKKIVVVLGDGLYYRCTDYKGSSDCHGDNKSKVQSSMLSSINTSLNILRNQGIELYFVKYSSYDDGSNGYTHYQNLYDLPGEYFDKSKFKSTSSPCNKSKNCRKYGGTKIMYYATSGPAVTNELVKYIVRAGNGIKIGNSNEAAIINSHYIKTSGGFKKTLDNLANTITNNINTVNINYDYKLTDYIYDAFIHEDTGFQGGSHEYRISGNGTITTQPFYIKIADNLKNIDNDDNWYKTNNDFNLKFKKEGKDVNISCRINPQVYWVGEKLNVDSCLGTAQYNKTYNLSSKYYNIDCKEGYDNKNGFVANFNVGGITSETNSFQTGGFGFPVTVELSTNVSCTYKFDTNIFKTDYNNLNSCLSTNKENTPEYASCYKRKLEMDKIVNNYINIVGNNNEKGKNLEEYISDFENINGDLVFNYNDNTTDSLNFVTSDFNKSIQCTNGSSSKLVNNQIVYTDFSCYLSLSKKLQLDNTCIDMQTANQTNCSTSTLNGGNLYYMNLDKKKASILINISSTGYMGNVGIGLQNCHAMQNIDFNIIYRPIDLTDPFLQSFDSNRKIGKNYLNSKYNFVNIIKKDLWNSNNNFMYRYTMSKINVENIRKDTNEGGINSYLGRNCYISNNKYKCDFTRNKITIDGISDKRDWFTKVEINE